MTKESSQQAEADELRRELFLSPARALDEQLAQPGLSADQVALLEAKRNRASQAAALSLGRIQP